MKSPRVSIILPVHKGSHLTDTIETIKKQTIGEFEVLCITGESEAELQDVLQAAAEQDSRFVILSQNGGSAENCGLSAARGDYVLFADCDTALSSEMLERLFSTAANSAADVAACNYSVILANGRESLRCGIYTNRIRGGVRVFSRRDCPDFILQVTGSVIWNKLFRREFLLRQGLNFAENCSYGDIFFAACALAEAEKITYTTDYLVSSRAAKQDASRNPQDVHGAITAAVDRIGQLAYAGEIRKSLNKFVVENYIGTLKQIRDFSAPEAVQFYQAAHRAFNTGEYLNLKPDALFNNELHREFRTVRKHDYETMKVLASRRIIVSMTSYPRRIGAVADVLENIYTQTRKADEVLLWLAEEQFPGREEDLPERLKTWIREDRLTVRWCDDMKGHKKYFYALQEYTNDVVVTIDDDLIYPKDMLETLYKSYLLHPNAVHTFRAHLMLISEDNRILPYDDWIHETDACIWEPCTQLMASGGAGDLYPPNLFRKEFFDREVVYEYCLWADNLWVKAMELVSDVPVVLARSFEPLRCVGDTQEETLYQINGLQNHYDIQLERISEWLDKTFSPGILIRKLTEEAIDRDIHGIKAVSHHLDTERKANRWRKLQAEAKLKDTEAQLQQIRKQLNQTENDLRSTRSKLQTTEENLNQIIADLRSTQQQLTAVQKQKDALEPLSTVGGQYRNLGSFLRELKEEKGISASWCVKYALYVLAWLPAKCLSGVNAYVRNGLKHTIRSVTDQKQN